jgi:hypothetical protein
VVIADPRNATGNRELDSLGPLIGARIREAIRATGRYELADEPSGAQRVGGRARASIARSVGAGAVVVGLYYYQRSHPDSFTVQIQIEDLRRGYTVKAVQSRPVAVEEATSGVAALAEKVVEALAEVAWRQ